MIFFTRNTKNHSIYWRTIVTLLSNLQLLYIIGISFAPTLENNDACVTVFLETTQQMLLTLTYSFNLYVAVIFLRMLDFSVSQFLWKLPEVF